MNHEVDVKDAVERGVALVRKKKLTESEAAEKVFDPAGFGEKEVHRLAKRQLAIMISQADAYQTRRTPKKERENKRENKPMVEAVLERVEDRLYRIRLRGADGEKKHLAAFSVTDIRWWLAHARTEQRTWAGRETWFEAAYAFMLEAGVKTIEDLPEAERAKLNHMTGDIW